MVECNELAKEIFASDIQIAHLGILDLEGNVLLDQSASSSSPMDVDAERLDYYHQLGARRIARAQFDQFYGKTDYVHIVRQNIQQLIIYLPTFTIYLTLEKSTTADETKKITQKVKLLNSELMKSGI